MVKALPNRSEVNVEETWNLEDLFKTEADYEAAIATLEQDVAAYVSQFQSKIIDAKSAIEALKGYENIFQQIIPIGTYTNLSVSTDQTNDDAQMRASKLGSIIAKINSQLSFVKSDLLALSTETLEDAMKEAPDFQNYLQELIRTKPYLLHPEVEKALAAFSATLMRRMVYTIRQKWSICRLTILL